MNDLTPQNEQVIIHFQDGRILPIRQSDVRAIETRRPRQEFQLAQRVDHGAIKNQQINQAHHTFFAIGAVFCFGIVGFLLLASIAKFLAAPTIVQPPPVEVKCPIFGTCNVK